MSCACGGAESRAISPLKGWLTRSTNELKYLAAKVASQLSYRQAAAILHELYACASGGTRIVTVYGSLAVGAWVKIV
jgi:hypothetical protein